MNEIYVHPAELDAFAHRVLKPAADYFTDINAYVARHCGDTTGLSEHSLTRKIAETSVDDVKFFRSKIAPGADVLYRDFSDLWGAASRYRDNERRAAELIFMGGVRGQPPDSFSEQRPPMTFVPHPPGRPSRRSDGHYERRPSLPPPSALGSVRYIPLEAPKTPEGSPDFRTAWSEMDGNLGRIQRYVDEIAPALRVRDRVEELIGDWGVLYRLSDAWARVVGVEASLVRDLDPVRDSATGGILPQPPSDDDILRRLLERIPGIEPLPLGEPSPGIPPQLRIPLLPRPDPGPLAVHTGGLLQISQTFESSIPSLAQYWDGPAARSFEYHVRRFNGAVRCAMTGALAASRSLAYLADGLNLIFGWAVGKLNGVIRKGEQWARKRWGTGTLLEELTQAAADFMKEIEDLLKWLPDKLRQLRVLVGFVETAWTSHQFSRCDISVFTES